MPDLPMLRDEQMRRFDFCFDDISSFSPFHDFHDFQQKAVDACPAGGTIVEIGCFNGRSLVCLGLMAREANKELRIFGVDNNDIGGSTACQVNLKAAGLKDFVTFLGMSSFQASKWFADNSIWLTFIDGSHTHEDVRDDIIAWMPKVEKDGWLCGHDALMHTVAQPVHAMLGVENVITDNIDIWIVRKQEIRASYNIHADSYRPEVIKGSWRS